MIDLHKIKKEAESVLEKNPESAQAFEIYALAKLLCFIEHHAEEEHSEKKNTLMVWSNKSLAILHANLRGGYFFSEMGLTRG